jgi:hypothetical protein
MLPLVLSAPAHVLSKTQINRQHTRYRSESPILLGARVLLVFLLHHRQLSKAIASTASLEVQPIFRVLLSWVELVLPRLSP